MASKTKKTKSNGNDVSRKRPSTQKKLGKYNWHFKVFNGYNDAEKEIIKRTLDKNLITQKFNRKDLLMAKSNADLNTMDTPIKYRISKNATNMLYTFTFLHHGQRKLFNTELYLLSRYLKSHDSKANVVYAGAAAGNHFPYLSSLFPNVDFHLYDPAKFSIKPTKRLHIYNEFYTDDISTSWTLGGEMHKKWGGCHFFLCDIRVDISDKNDNAREAQVTEDMNRQQKWAQLIKPKIASMLKFRPPYDATATLEYLPGIILWQTWPGKASGETRLITEGHQFNNKLVKYNVGKYENICALHNVVHRPYSKYTDINLFRLVPGYDGSWDSRAEAETWKMYLEKVKGMFPTPRNIANKMNKLTYSLKQPLNPPSTYHGRYTNHIHGNRWLWMLTRDLQRIDRDKINIKRHAHEINRVKGLGVKGYLIKK